jgi:hypothetical protein
MSPSQSPKPTFPTRYEPELATLVKAPSGEEWLHKIEFDGRFPPLARAVGDRGARRHRASLPELVCEVAFTDWTPEGTLRHPSFQGLGEDKGAKEVIHGCIGAISKGGLSPSLAVLVLHPV